MGLYEEIFKLKNLERTGWIFRNCKSETGRVESDAEHTFSMAILALEIINKEKLPLNQEKVLKMILYHELGEIDFGDHTPMENISAEEKYLQEQKCVKRVAKECGMLEILSLWEEFEKCETPEAIFVKKIDKLDNIKQSKIYSQIIGDGTVFEEFKNNRIDIAKEFHKYI